MDKKLIENTADLPLTTMPIRNNTTERTVMTRTVMARGNQWAGFLNSASPGTLNSNVKRCYLCLNAHDKKNCPLKVRKKILASNKR